MSRAQRIHDALSKQLMAEICHIEDETHRHHVPKDAESHFKLTVVSAQFNDLARIARHRLVNQILQDEFTQGLHALSLHLYSPSEWLKRNHSVPASPPCRDGKRHDIP